jgi:L-amino acid N-acyltransferase YncA
VTLGGSEGWVDEVFIRPSVRRRGIGTEVLHSIAVALSKGGVKALHVRVPQDADVTQRFCERVGFTLQPNTRLMSDIF